MANIAKLLFVVTHFILFNSLVAENDLGKSPERAEQIQVTLPVVGQNQTLPVVGQNQTLSCPSPTLAHGTVKLVPRGTARIYPGDMAWLECDKGYELKLNDFSYSYSYISCSDSGQWTTPHGFKLLPTCQAKVCGLPKEIPYGTYDVRPPNDEPTGQFVYGSKAYYECVDGYVLQDARVNVLVCKKDQWEGSTPVCRARLACPKPPLVANSDCTLYGTSEGCDNGLQIYYNVNAQIYYRCQEGYRMVSGDAMLQCKKGSWSGDLPLCESHQPAMCGPPPRQLHGDFNLYPNRSPAREGATAKYYCLNGYSFEGDKPNVERVCHHGQWVGDVPACLKRLHCDVPQNIDHGNWVVLGPESKFSVGMTISYECNTGYSPFGKTKLVCLSSGYWSDNPPKCFEKGTYCADPGKVENGFYVCQPQHCSMFSVGTTISYVCESGYEPLGDIQQTCLRGSVWSGPKPVCMPIMTTPKVDATLGINSGTVTVVIATTCCVLGLLLVVMIVVALQRRKPSPRLCHAVPPPPPAYPRPRSDSMDEHDRVALIASADGVHVVLPSYEEATRGRGSSSTPRFHSGGDSSSVRRGDYRPLPTIPASMRNSGSGSIGGRLDSPRAGGQLGPDHHRNSIITNSSLARDNISLVFGSIDTMNISDGTSTSVTIETFDSGASNPSLALSQRAATGSLGSSHGSLANEDAPLLDNISESGRTALPPRATETIVTEEQKQE